MKLAATGSQIFDLGPKRQLRQQTAIMIPRLIGKRILATKSEPILLIGSLGKFTVDYQKSLLVKTGQNLSSSR